MVAFTLGQTFVIGPSKKLNLGNAAEIVSIIVFFDISILKKTEIFDEKIVKAIFNSKDYQKDKAKAIVMLFRYIEKFNYDYEELESKITDKKLLHRLFWELAQVASDEFV